MDAVKFVREFRRMCRKYYLCANCPLDKMLLCDSNKELSQEEAERTVRIVEKWSKENPEEIGKKYIIEIDAITKNSCHVKGTGNLWFDRGYLKSLEEYKESEE